MSGNSLAGRVALVTGGSRGIGRAICQYLAEEGATVAVNYNRDNEAADETVRLITEAGGKAQNFGGSVNDPEAAAKLVADVEGAFGSISILVNNAGIASRGQSIAKTDPQELMKVLSVHAMGPFFVTQAALPGMRTCERGDVIVISSVATKTLNANGAPYNMGKVAADAFAYTLAKEERRNNIRVNIVAPGLVDTDMGQKLMKATAGVDDLRKLDEHMPFGHVCQPEEIATVVRYLVSPANPYMTGQKVFVDGGASDQR